MSQVGNLMATASEPPPQPVFKEPRPVNPNSLPFFSRIVEDIIVNIFGRLEEDPRDLARLACVCRRFHSVIKTSCYKRQCMRVVPTIVSELMQSSYRQDVLGEPPGGWGALQKLLVCCPGLRHAGVLLNCWDYGLEREIGRSDDFQLVRRDDLPKVGVEAEKNQEAGCSDPLSQKQEKNGGCIQNKSDDLQGQRKDLEVSSVTSPHQQEDKTMSIDVRRNCCKKEISNKSNSAGTLAEGKGQHCRSVRSEQRGVSGGESLCPGEASSEADAGKCPSGKRKKRELMEFDGPIKQMKKGGIHYHGKVMKEPRFHGSYRRLEGQEGPGGSWPSRGRERRGAREKSGDASAERRTNEMERPGNHEEEPHLAKGAWILTREQGNKLLASRFRSDSLYICDWPGCLHQGEKRVYKLFRGIFKDFQHSHVFRNLKDLKAKRTEIRCAFCVEETYDMVTSFCLRRSFEYHEDGEPVIRAYVCESGHVAGAWTDRPLYNL